MRSMNFLINSRSIVDCGYVLVLRVSGGPWMASCPEAGWLGDLGLLDIRGKPQIA